MIKNLTKRTVDALRATRKAYLVWDEALTGFGLKVTPTGRKAFVAQYRVPGAGRRGTARRLKIGDYGAIAPDEARALAKKVLASVHHGKDPARERSAMRIAPLVADLAPRFLESVERDLKPKTAYEYRRMFGFVKLETGHLRQNSRSPGDILPHIGRQRVQDIARPDVAKVRESKDGRYAANRVLALLSTFFAWCEEHGHRTPGTNPCRGIKRHREEARRRYLAPGEARSLGKALRAVEKEGGNRYAVAAIRFLLLTGFREQEALSLPWSAINLATGTVNLREAKTVERERTLNVPALELLAILPRVDGNPYVFPGLREGDHIHEIKRVWTKVRDEAELHDFRLHDLRHSFASAAISSGATLAVVGELLGHRLAQTTKRYAHLHDDARRAASDQASGTLAAWLDGSETAVTPIHLRASRR